MVYQLTTVFLLNNLNNQIVYINTLTLSPTPPAAQPKQEKTTESLLHHCSQEEGTTNTTSNPKPEPGPLTYPTIDVAAKALPQHENTREAEYSNGFALVDAQC